MVLVNILLMVSAVKEVPCQTLPWLCANTVTIIIAMVNINFFQTNKSAKGLDYIVRESDDMIFVRTLWINL